MGNDRHFHAPLSPTICEEIKVEKVGTVININIKTKNIFEGVIHLSCQQHTWLQCGQGWLAAPLQPFIQKCISSHSVLSNFCS
jgi:hypothetical protein